MKKALVATLSCCFVVFSQATFALGIADCTFGNDSGRTLTSFTTYSQGEYAYDVAIYDGQAAGAYDGYIVTVGSARISSTDGYFTVTRHTPAGVLDTTFGGGDGMVNLDMSSTMDSGTAVAIQSDGKIIVVGNVGAGSPNQLGIVRLTTAGVIDTTFGTSGKTIQQIGSSISYATDVAVLSNNDIVISGQSNNVSEGVSHVVKYTAAGVYSGIYTTNLRTGCCESFSGLAIDGSDNIVVVGYANNGTNNTGTVMRLTSALAADATFNSGAALFVTFGGTGGGFEGVAIQTDGKILVGGNDTIGGNTNWTIARLNTNGTLDTSFSTDGKQNFATGAYSHQDGKIAIQSDGKILQGGYTGWGFGVVRYTSTGTVDTTFSTDGFEIVSWDDFDYGYGIALQKSPSEKVILYGFSDVNETAGTTNRDQGLIRVNLHDVDMSYCANTVTQNTLPIAPGATGDILQVKVSTSGTLNAQTASNFSFATTGTTNVADIASAQLYYTGASSNFSTSTPVGSSIASPSGTFNVTNATTLLQGDNYFWLAYTVASGATLTNVLDSTVSGFTMSTDGAKTAATSAPTGSREISNVLAVYDIGSNNPSNGATSLPATSTATNVTAGAITIGSSVTASTWPSYYDGGSFVFTNWPTSPTTYDANSYYEISLAPTAGKQLTYENISFSLARDAFDLDYNGPQTIQLRYSTDNFASSTLLQTIDMSTATDLQQVPYTVSLASLGTQSGTVKFRWYPYNRTGNLVDSGFGFADANSSDPNVYFTGTGSGLVVKGAVSSIATAPGAPTIGTATAGDTQASVAFTAPASDGGSAIIGYTATSSPGNKTSIGCTASPCTVTGLTNGTPYTFTVTATNAIGTSTASSASSSITPKANQTITFGTAPSMTYGGGSGTVSATATSGLTVTFASTTPLVCSVSGTTVTTVTAGTCTIAANQSGNAAYNAAPQVTQSFSIAKAAQAISFNPAPTVVVDGTGTVSATGGASGNAVTFGSTTPSVCSVSGSTVTGIIAGTCTIAANQAGNTNYSAAPQATQSITVGKGSQSISFGAAPTMTYGGGTGTVSAAATSGLIVALSSTTSGICSISGTTVTGLAAGTCIIAANQTGNINYNAATQVTQSITIAKANQTISFGAAPSMTYGGGTGTVSATTTSNLTVTFSSTTTGVCTVSGNNVTTVTAGTCIIAANQTGNTNYNAANQVTQSFTIAKATQVISFNAAPSVVVDGTGTVSATGGASGNAVTFGSTTPSVCSVSGSTVTGIIAGTCTIAANQAGNTNYNAAAQVTQNISVGQGSQSISFGVAPSLNVNGTATVSATATSGLTVALTSNTPSICSISGTTVSGITAGTCTIAANQVGNANYTAALQVTQDITSSAVVPNAPTIGSATGGNAQASVSFSAPGSDGGSAITGYTMTSSPGGHIGTGASSPITVSGLSNGTAYTFSVTATNAVGVGVSSTASNSVTPATIPDAPTIGTATGGAAEAVVNFSAPLDNGGNAISSYTVTSSPDGITASGSISPITVTGLTDGTAYAFTVIATNGVGDSAASSLSNSAIPDSPPVITVPADVTVNATGLFTAVDTGMASANDSTDGILVPTSNASSHFAPGMHLVTWSVTDAGGNTSIATQNVNVIPLVNLSIDQTAREGDTITIKAILNGDAVSYPVTVPYTVSGTAATDSSDHNLADGSIIIGSPDLEASVAVSLVDDGAGEGDETIIVTMGTPTNAVKGSSDIHTTTISELNQAPEVVLSADQGSGITTQVSQSANVTVTANVSDTLGDTHSFDWAATDNVLIDTDGAINTFSFDPASLTPGIYTLRVTVTDNNSGSSEADLILNVVASLPTLTSTDTDGDGSNDDTEGHGDDDNDGIANYLDHGSLSNNVVPGKHGKADQFLLETEAGLKVRLGKVAFRAGRDSTNVSMDDITTHANDGAGARADGRHDYSSGMFDFVISKLPTSGQSIRVVLAQQAPLPVNAIYRKYANGVWQNFVEDDNNSVASATGEEGFCPPPGDAAYTAELTESDWCVQLTIEDGGPNDDDGIANRSISDPGGATQNIPGGYDNDSILDRARDAVGAANPWWLFIMLSMLPVRRLLKRKQR
ncbi:MAG: fibronectin type III domain-containing protein [Gammaproteobacteria bacterium]|nr:fibronectin type III domain-containing protein [Gammaproteobacteria bacterium]